jgi:phosphoadenosine phosphosulfate reductase
LQSKAQRTKSALAQTPLAFRLLTMHCKISIPQQITALARYAQPSAVFADVVAATERTLRDAAARYQPIIQASSLGAEDVVISHLIQSLGLDIPAFVLETGALHQETLQLLERIQAKSVRPIQVIRPDTEAVLGFVRAHGEGAMYRSLSLRKTCCRIRKMEPLRRALQGQKTWVTGLRQEQSEARAEVLPLDTSEVAQGGLVKCNPLANWTWGDVWHYIQLHGLDYNPLHDNFMPSIGCAPCTRAISDGEEFRAGRWWWESENAKECGLHVKESKA